MRIRRIAYDPRIEMTPMIDVVFLLLVFFIYSMILMVRADLLPMNLRAFQSGQPARPRPAAVVSIDLAGALFLDRQPATLAELRPRIEARRA